MRKLHLIQVGGAVAVALFSLWIVLWDDVDEVEYKAGTAVDGKNETVGNAKKEVVYESVEKFPMNDVHKRSDVLRLKTIAVLPNFEAFVVSDDSSSLVQSGPKQTVFVKGKLDGKPFEFFFGLSDKVATEEMTLKLKDMERNKTIDLPLYDLSEVMGKQKYLYYNVDSEMPENFTVTIENGHLVPGRHGMTSLSK